MFGGGSDSSGPTKTKAQENPSTGNDIFDEKSGMRRKKIANKVNQPSAGTSLLGGSTGDY
jgi:hypothetical protein